MMSIIEPIIRPPSEANNFLLQVTTGCSSDHCTFCGAYKGKPFTVKSFEDISSDIEEGVSLYPDTRRIFLMDGDALIMDNARLIPVLKELNAAFPEITRISSYANGYNITGRTPEELKELYTNKLTLIYLGLESGNQSTLDNCDKRSSAREMIKAVNMATAAGIKSSVIVLLGIGGKDLSKEHVVDTITALNIMQPRYLSFLSLMLIPGTRMYNEAQNGIFRELSSSELLQEAYDIMKGLELKRTVFRSNHASNYFYLGGCFPKDKDRLLKELKDAVEGKKDLRADFLRGL